MCCTEEGEVVKESKIKQKLRSAQQKKLKDQVSGQAWQGKLIAFRWEEEQEGSGTGMSDNPIALVGCGNGGHARHMLSLACLSCTNSYFPPECTRVRRQ